MRAGAWPRHNHGYCTSHFLFVLAQGPATSTNPLSSCPLGSSSSKQNPHLSNKKTQTMQTARARPELLTGEEFGAIHPFRDCTSPGRGDVSRPQPLVLSAVFWPHLWQSVFRSWSETKARGRALGGDGHSPWSQPSTPPTVPCSGALRHRRLIHSFSAAKIFQRYTNTRNSSWVTLSHPLLVMRWFMLFIF